MRSWTGLSDDSADVGDGLTFAGNVSLYYNGVLGRRPGLGEVYAEGGVAVQEQGPVTLYVQADGTVVSQPVPHAMGHSLTAAVVPAMVQAFARIYLSDGQTPVLVSDNGTYLRVAGIAAPTVDPVAAWVAGGSIDSGVRLLRYRYFDSARQRYSDPSDPIELTLARALGQATISSTAGSSIDVTYAGGGYVVTPGAIAQLPNGGATLAVTVTMTADSVSALTPSSWGSGLTDNPLIVVDAPTGGSLTIDTTALLSSDRYVSDIMIELTASGAETFYVAATVSNTAQTVTLADPDTLLIQNQDAGIFGDFGHQPPPQTLILHLHRNRLWTWDALFLLSWSGPGEPEGFNLGIDQRLITLGQGDVPVALASLYTDLYCIGQRSMVRMIFTDDPALGMALPVPGTFGAFNPRCVCDSVPGVLFGWGEDGAWLLDAMAPKKISKKAEVTIAALADNSKLAERFVVYEPTERAVQFFFVLTGDTACKAAAAYYLERGEWVIWQYTQAMTAGCASSGTDFSGGRPRLLLASSSDSWLVGTQANDAGSAINQQVTTQWHAASASLESKQRPAFLFLAFRPAATGNGTAHIQIFTDFSATAYVFTANSFDENYLGVTVSNGSATITVDLDQVPAGFVQIPLPGDWSRTIRADVQISTTGPGAKLLDLRFAAMERSREAVAAP